MYRMRPRQNPGRCPEGGVLTVRWLPLRPHLCHIEAVTCRRSRWGRLTSGFVRPVGVEPTTRGLKVRCSAIELEARDMESGRPLESVTPIPVPHHRRPIEEPQAQVVQWRSDSTIRRVAKAVTKVLATPDLVP